MSKQTTSQEYSLNITVAKAFPKILELSERNLIDQILCSLKHAFPLQSTFSLTDSATICTMTCPASDQKIRDFINKELNMLASEYMLVAQDIKDGHEIGKQYHSPKYS